MVETAIPVRSAMSAYRKPAACNSAMRLGQDFISTDPTSFRNQCQRLAVTDIRYNSEMETIGDRIRKERTAQGLARKDLAKDAGVSYTALSDLELGNSANTTALHRIATRLGKSVTYLETGKDDRIGGSESAVDTELQSLRYAVASLASVMIIHRPIEAMDAARAIRRKVPARFQRQGFLHELLAVLEIAALPAQAQDVPKKRSAKRAVP